MAFNIFDEQDLMEKKIKNKSRMKYFLEYNISVIKLIIGFFALLVCLALGPRPDNSGDYASNADEIISNSIGLIFILYVLFILYWIGFKQGTKLYRQEFISIEEKDFINKILASGKEVYLKIEGRDIEMEEKNSKKKLKKNSEKKE